MYDYKRHASVHPDKLQFSWGDFAGDMQAAMALDGWRSVTGEKRNGFANITQMPKPPYLAQMMVYDPEQIEAGRIRYQRALEIAARCLEAGHWPKYSDGPAYYKTPHNWQYKMEALTDAPEQPGSNAAGAQYEPHEYAAAL